MLAAGLSYAQDLSEATETAKSAVEAFESGNKTEALTLFNQALELATACGEAGNDIVSGFATSCSKFKCLIEQGQGLCLVTALKSLDRRLCGFGRFGQVLSIGKSGCKHKCCK